MTLRNMHGIVRGSIQAVNKDVAATLKTSTGYTKGADYKQVPTYTTSAITAQVQPLTTGDIRHLDSLNIQGSDKVAFLYGAALAIVQVKALGGALVVFPDGTLPEGNTWLVNANLEQWIDPTGGPSWCKVALKLQLDT